MNVKTDITWRIVVCYLFMVVFGMAIIYKVLHIQVVEGKYWRSLADSLTLTYKNIPAERGNIYSEDGRMIATSLPTFDIHFDAGADGLTDDLFEDKVDTISGLLSKMFGDKSMQEYRRLLVSARHSSIRYALIHKDVTYPQLVQIKTWPLFKLGQNGGGLIVSQIDKRLYPYDDLALRTIGYIRGDNTQPVGIEAAYNNDLTGTPGKQLMRKIAAGVYMPINNAFEIDPKNGKDVLTTIDVTLQDEAEQALEKTLVKNDADHGCVIVMEVKTGKIRALANLGKKSDGTYGEIFNYAIGENREPGSTFKAASMMALLEDNYVNLNDTIDVELGHHMYFTQMMKDAEEHGYRRIPVIKAFAISSNVGVSKLVYKNYARQPEKYLAHLHDWHLDEALGIGIPGEAVPYIKHTSDKTWSAVSLPWMSVGYELRVSPLNICTFYNAIANNGVMMKPYLVSEIQEYGKPIKKFNPVVLNPKVCNDSTLKRMYRLMEAVVNYGTAVSLKNPFYSIAGKTGTAQITQDLGSAEKAYQASFCGFFPADNPLYTICVVINKPSMGVYYGASVAGPVFKDIADKVYANASYMHKNDTSIARNKMAQVTPIVCKGYAPDFKVLSPYLHSAVVESTSGEWVHASAINNAIDLAVDTHKDDVVPDVKGMGLRDAIYLLENMGLQVQVIGAGFVKDQSIHAGQSYKKGQTIILKLS